MDDDDDDDDDDEDDDDDFWVLGIDISYLFLISIFFWVLIVMIFYFCW